MVKSNLLIIKQFLQKNKWLIAFFFLVFSMFIVNTIHEAFPDEYDNIVGGWYINRGILPYIGFFSHHNPGAYFLSSVITLFTGQSFVTFRLVFGSILFIYITASFFILQRKFNSSSTYFYLGFIALLALSATYFWGQMMLSETIVGYAFVPAYVLFLLKYMRKEDINGVDLITISILTFISLWTSLTYIFAIGIFNLFVIYYFLRKKLTFKNIFIAGSIFLFPYILFLGYLFVTGSIERFIFSSIIYNRDYYIYNFPIVAGQISKNPIRYAISIFYERSLEFYLLAQQLKDFNFAYPLNVTLMLGNFVFLTYLLFRKKFVYASLAYLILIFLNMRSEPLNSKETDFHSTVYIMISFINSLYVYFELIKKFTKLKIDNLISFVELGLFSLMTIYGFFAIGFFGWKFSDKAYGKLMGRMPAIYDRPVVAPIINKIVSKDDYFWIGPFEFQELLYINGKLPSKYHWFLPANERSERIRTEFVSDIQKNKPKLIVFKEDLSYFGTSPKDFNYPIVNILHEHYFRIEDLEKEGRTYESVEKNLHNFDVKVNFYYDKTKKEEIVAELLQKNIIKKVE